jgi:hypothetical protein
MPGFKEKKTIIQGAGIMPISNAVVMQPNISKPSQLIGLTVVQPQSNLLKEFLPV